MRPPTRRSRPRGEELRARLLNARACSTGKPCAAPEMIERSAPGMRSASSSPSAVGVRMSWLPDTTSVGTRTSTSRSRSESSVSRIAGLAPRTRARDVQGERAEHTEGRPEPTQRPRTDEPADRPAADLAHAMRARSPPTRRAARGATVVMAGGGTEHERPNPIGMAQREELRDHAAHRVPIRAPTRPRTRRARERRRRPSRRGRSPPRLVGSSDAAVVEADRSVAAPDRQPLEPPAGSRRPAPG